MKTINGIVPVMLTPFAADERIDYPALWRRALMRCLPSVNQAKCSSFP